MAHSSQSPEVVNQRAKIKRTFIGHKQRIFHLCKTADGRSMISASEDGTCKVWDLASRKCSATLVHNRDAEVLRATFFPDERTICTGGSDGAVCVWQRSSLDDAAAYNKLAHLDHGEDAQIYACEPVASSENDGGIELLTAADNRIFIWDIQRSERPSAVYDFHRIQSFDVPNESKSSNSQSSPTSIDADPSQQGAASAGIQPFGGERNPDDLVFVFDVKMCPVHTNIISAAMSDATIRLIDVRMRQQPMQYSLSLEGASDYGTGGQKFGHATSVRSLSLCSP